MKRLLLILVLIAAAISGCLERGPSETGSSENQPNLTDLKVQAIRSADNLSTYSLISSANQTLKLSPPQDNTTSENITVVRESVRTTASVNLSANRASASGSTTSQVEVTGQMANSSSSKADVYQIGNSTYVMEEGGNWTHLKDPRSAEEIWSGGNNNQVKVLAETINQSQVEFMGREMIDGEDTYKLKIVTGSGEYNNLYNTAFGIAAKMTQYPLYIPSINSTELNETSEIEKMVWISEETNLPRKYTSTMSFKMTPLIVAGMDPSKGEIKMFNQSVRMGEVAVDLETTDLYYDFNESVQINPPVEALSAEPINPAPIQVTMPT